MISKCRHGAKGFCPDCKQESTLMGGVGEVSTRKKSVNIKVDVFDMSNKKVATVVKERKAKIGMCAWHTCQKPHTADSRLCIAHNALQAKLDSTPLPKAR